MISKTAYEIANTIHEGSELPLRPVLDTTLADLVRANISTHTYAMASSPDTPMSIDVVKTDSERMELDGTEVHGETLKSSITGAAKIVLANIQLAKNSAILDAKTVHEYYDAIVSDRLIDAQNVAVMVTHRWADVWSNSHLPGLVARFENIPSQEYIVPTGIPLVSEGQIKEMMVTGVASLDEDVSLLLRDLADGELTTIYNRIFRDGLAIGKPITPMHTVVDSELTAVDYLIGHLISINFEKQLPENVNMSLNTIRLIMTTVRKVTGNAIIRAMQLRDRNLKYKTLAYRTEKHDYYIGGGRPSVYVNYDVYAKFMADGGKPEHLYGALLSGDKIDYDAILEKRERYERFYHQRASALKHETMARNFTAQRESLLHAITRFINEKADNDEGVDIARGELHKCAQRCISNMDKPSCFEDTWLLVRDLVCDVFYSDTDVKDFLSAWDTIADSDELDPKECALYATIDYVSRWIAAQIEIQG